MKTTVLGVKRIEGTAKVSGNPFDMCRLFCMVPIEQASGKTKVSGFGYELGEMELLPESLASFASVKFPAQLDLMVEQKFMFGEFKSFVTGLLAAPVVKAA